MKNLPPSKAKITKILLLLSAVSLSGCLSMNPDKAQRKISHWIPAGTSQDDAIRIMRQHRFQVSPTLENGQMLLSCQRETKFLRNSWWLYIRLKNGKVISVDRPVTDNDFFLRYERSRDEIN
jgi:hypothetical protein